jgi:hypothetical protein
MQKQFYLKVSENYKPFYDVMRKRAVIVKPSLWRRFTDWLSV